MLGILDIYICTLFIVFYKILLQILFESSGIQPIFSAIFVASVLSIKRDLTQLRNVLDVKHWSMPRRLWIVVGG